MFFPCNLLLECSNVASKHVNIFGGKYKEQISTELELQLPGWDLQVPRNAMADATIKTQPLLTLYLPSLNSQAGYVMR